LASAHINREYQLDAKQLVGMQAAGEIREGMVVGLGTGSTAYHFIREAGRRIREEGLRIQAVASSFSSSMLAREQGIPLLSMDQVDHVDLYADGADEVAPDKGLLKGRGAAMVGEKLLVQVCDRFLVIVDESKLVDHLGTRFPVPVEVLPCAWLISQAGITSLGGACTLRQALRKDGPVITDHGNFVLDATFPANPDWPALDRALNDIPGVVGHGLFLRYGGKTQVLIGTSPESGEAGSVRIIP
jgi:ribose 5-phosphate isomerase A